MALDGVTSFWRLKDVTNTCKHLRNSHFFRDFFSANKYSSFIVCSNRNESIVCSNRNRSALMRDLLSYDSLLFVGQLYEDKSLALRAHDLIFFTTDLQAVNY